MGLYCLASSGIVFYIEGLVTAGFIYVSHVPKLIWDAENCSRMCKNSRWLTGSKYNQVPAHRIEFGMRNYEFTLCGLILMLCRKPSSHMYRTHCKDELWKRRNIRLTQLRLGQQQQLTAETLEERAVLHTINMILHVLCLTLRICFTELNMQRVKYIWGSWVSHLPKMLSIRLVFQEEWW